MPRNLDLTALRALAAVADAGGVTRAAGLLNLTQSAVSMQIKRLEEGLGQSFFNRAQRRLSLTPEGEQLLAYARRMLELNDEVLLRLTDTAFEGEIRLGVPHDIVYPAIPRILKAMAAEYPRLRINLVSCFTSKLKEGYSRGEFDVILTTEGAPGPGGERLATRRLVWVGAPDGIAWQQRPLRLAFIETCFFRPIAQAALNAAGIRWEMAVGGESEQVAEATVTADLSVTARMEGALPQGAVEIDGANALPDLGKLDICLYDAGMQRGEVVDRLLAQLRCAYGDGECCRRAAAGETGSERYDDLAGRLTAAQ
ncbi:MAG: LysR family transcriptional regulator [Defluviimonas sp.]|uniref:LysR family transcriptional regulator n=1 Tax=Albidovulum sp. TaxID=1872424 RepID=UPI001E14B2ED|nr:LysR family transcriptional regulator [Paracoccaceae bacterium]MCC0064619.1 LysR family transcriptional regulator [Defluviimonas sp.]